jgi:hypothetical protein
VLELASFACDFFKLAFHLCNDVGFQAAMVFSKVDFGPSYHWSEIKNNKASSSSYADVARVHRPPLTGANRTPLRSRVPPSSFSSAKSAGLNSSSAPKPRQTKERTSVYKRISFPRKSVFERLSFPDAGGKTRVQILNSKSKSPPSRISRPNTVSGHHAEKINACKRCFSPNHLRHACRSQIK